MPTLQLKISPPQSPQRHQTLAQALTRLTAQYLGKRPEVTAVMIEDLPAGQWCVAGESVSGATAWLEISVTAGTNTAGQKADFISAAFEALGEQLSPGQALEPASYVIVRELPASDWGYGGQTQLARQQAREKAAALPA